MMYEQLIKMADCKMSPLDLQCAVRNRFHELLSSGPLLWWRPGDFVNKCGKRVLIGVAPAWNVPDRYLLCALEKVVAAQSFPKISIELFDMDDCLSQEDINKHIPFPEKVYQPPLVGYWWDGELIATASGHEARMLIDNLMRPLRNGA